MNSNAFPMTIKSLSMDHKGGTKSYHLLLISSDQTGASVLINRFGKTGAFGQTQEFSFEARDHAEREFFKKYEEKSKNGYRETISAKSDDVTAITETALINLIGPQMWAKIKTRVANTLYGDATAIPVSDRAIANAKRLADQAELNRQIAEKIAADKAEKLRLERASYETNAAFGRF